MPRRYVALLRGINVGKAKRVSMAELRTVMADLGCGEVRTLLNSGNVVFSSAETGGGPEAEDIRAALLESTGVSARVTVLSAEQVAEIAGDNPLSSGDVDPGRMLISVFADSSLREQVVAMAEQDWGVETFHVGALATYTHSPNGVLESQCLKALEKVLGDAVTTRNLRTFDKLVGLL